MPDVYATIAEADQAVLEEPARVLELRWVDTGTFFGHIAYAAVFAGRR